MVEISTTHLRITMKGGSSGYSDSVLFDRSLFDEILPEKSKVKFLPMKVCVYVYMCVISSSWNVALCVSSSTILVCCCISMNVNIGYRRHTANVYLSVR